MAQVKFTPNLRRYFPDLRDCAIDARTVADIVQAADERWRGIGDYIIDRARTPAQACQHLCRRPTAA